jgi:hypothetical protein
MSADPLDLHDLPVSAHRLTDDELQFRAARPKVPMTANGLDVEEIADAIVSTIKAALKAHIPPLKEQIVALEKEVAELKARPVVHDAGVWTHGKVYEPGAIVSHRGSGWICSAAHLSTGDDLNHEHFRLFVKSGRDGKAR